MGRLLHLGALACLYLGVESKALRWQDDTPSWSPPKETIAAMDMEKLGFSPAPTAAPDPANVELKLAKRVRGDDTCGYISGISTNSIYCGVGSCVINSFRSVVGCCTEATVSNCNIMTSCLPSSSRAFYQSTDSLMEFCGISTAPECVTYVYSGSLFNDYTLYACNTAKASIVVYANPLDSTDDPAFTTLPGDDSSSLLPFPTTRTISPVPGPATSTGSSGGGGGGSPAPIGAIVGGVVGGLALIAIIILGVVFLLRKKKKDGQNNGNQAPPVMYDPQQQGGPHNGPGAPPQMYQTHPGQQPSSPGEYYVPGKTGGFPPGFAPVDNRQSMLKQSHDVTTGSYEQNGISPSVSPPPMSPSPTYQSGIPGYVPSQVSSNSPTQGGYPLPQQQQQQQQQQQSTTYHNSYAQPQTTTTTTHHSHHQSFASELPATRGDNELRELA
ncbi:hypothetical protein CPLU01_03811 [Colletotrichum plurivorum]|uniref:Uncharacterized protein n=1 Tax=Colletotrichum plurivorum TaxID=2175906 RepID=A0A8H6NKN1_9PEZI|nr:hypothetical protein CPLU01_03811 [Colletotrichum plurivorum]